MPRCVKRKDKPHFMLLSGMTDLQTGVIADYTVLPFETQEERDAKVKNTELWTLVENTPQFYSRYLQSGFKGKFQDIKNINGWWNVHIWVEYLRFNPFNDDDFASRRYLLHYYMVCMLCFIMSFLVEYMNQRRFNW